MKLLHEKNKGEQMSGEDAALPVDELDQYKDNPWAFVQFSTIPKLGMNMMSTESETPLGIYGWPLKEMFDDIKSGRISHFGDKPYLIVFEVKPEYRGKIMTFGPGPEEYAEEIARDRNVPESGSGYVTRFEVVREFMDRFDTHTHCWRSNSFRMVDPCRPGRRHEFKYRWENRGDW